MRKEDDETREKALRSDLSVSATRNSKVARPRSRDYDVEVMLIKF